LVLAGDDGFSGVLDRRLNTDSGFVGGLLGNFGIRYASVAWGDSDNDGQQDFFVTGNNMCCGTALIAQIWRKSDIVTLPNGVKDGSVAWGDLDNDGWLDIVLTGDADVSGIGAGLFKIWRNTGNGFSNLTAALPGVYRSSVALGDYDNDGDWTFC
jgi:hypothetical protein